MGILLCEQNFRDVWRRNKSVRAEIGQMLRTHTHAAKLVVEISGIPCIIEDCAMLVTWVNLSESSSSLFICPYPFPPCSLSKSSR